MFLLNEVSTVKKLIAVLSFASIFGMFAPSAMSQQSSSSQDEGERTDSGRVVSSTRNVVVIRTDDNRYHLFVFDRDTSRPGTIAIGSSVRVVSVPGGEPDARLARSITVSAPPPASGGAPGTQPQATTDVIPPTVRRLERDIERGARRYGVGVRAGAALDPELITLGVHANLGTVFTRSISVRPSAEFAFGEVTNLFALNLEALYRLPISPRQGRWSAYIGAGPSFSFIDQNFERAAQGNSREIDFGDFSFDAGFNILTGVQFRGGMFLEVKTSVYSSPHLRMMVGYNF
jgi:hypothetical protein